MHTLTCCVLLFCIWIHIPQITIGQSRIAGPAELIIKSVEQCPDPDQYKYFINVQRNKVNRTHEAFNGDTNIGIPLDEDTGIYVNVAKKAIDGYKPNAYEFRENNACLFLSKWISKTFYEILKRIGEPTHCPVKPGSYTLKNFIIDYRDMVATLPYGDFRADAYFIRDNEKALCLQVFITTKPKVGMFNS